MNLSREVEAQLGHFIGLPLWSCGLASNMLWTQFGARCRNRSPLGRLRTVGEYAFHVQCDWRFVMPDGLRIESGGELCRERLAWVEEELLPTNVGGLYSDHVGGIIISLENGLVLKVSPDASCAEEQWRMFSPGRPLPHVILEGNHLVIEEEGLTSGWT